jgi:hypothetical protein
MTQSPECCQRAPGSGTRKSCKTNTPWKIEAPGCRARLSTMRPLCQTKGRGKVLEATQSAERIPSKHLSASDSCTGSGSCCPTTLLRRKHAPLTRDIWTTRRQDISSTISQEKQRHGSPICEYDMRSPAAASAPSKTPQQGKQKEQNGAVSLRSQL